MIKALFYSIAVSLLFISVSCGSSNNAEVTPLTKEEVNESQNVQTGVVQYREGCEWVIEVVENQEKLVFYPVNLPSEYQKKGIRLSFIFQPSRAPQPANCVVDRVVSVEQIKLIKERK